MATDPATLAQIRAADPGASTWVSANAGAGKTSVLTDRVARLLLAGTDPARILCLTYTRAAAAEMQDRLFRRLGTWAMLPDDALAGALARLSETPRAPDPQFLAAARRLFAQALETPGGLKIQTIHAFCDTVLRRFPLEAGVAPGFGVIEGRDAALAVEATLDALARAADRGTDDAFDALALLLSEDSLRRTAGAILHRRDLFAGDPARADLAVRLGLQREPTPALLLDDILSGYDRARLGTLAHRLVAQGGKVAPEAGTALAGALRAPTPGEALAHLEAAFLTDKGEPRKTGVPPAPWRTGAPDDAALVDLLKERTATARERRLALARLDLSDALHRFARRFLAGHAAAKARGGWLDFDDLVTRTGALLAGSAFAAFVLWRLDGGIDHILIDEAQDTSPRQWQVIGALAEEMLAGEGARGPGRTIFAVGDPKQSIYSFQGADPAGFAAMQGRIAARLALAERPLSEGVLRHSFRSAPAILRLVDRVFAGPAGAGVALAGGPVLHEAFHPGMPGRVELWPWLGAPGEPEPPEWWKPLDVASAGDPKLVLARCLAAEIARWTDGSRAFPLRPRGHKGSPEPRAVRPGDILVLVQRRDTIATGLIAALKGLGVPVAGEDRMLLGRQIAVQDLLAVLRFVATPADELSLAAALRSPLCGLSEDALFALAQGRDRLLWQALRQSPHEAAAEMFQDLRAEADFRRPHELLERLLTRHGGRRRLVARLGTEAEDGIDEVLAQAIAFEASEVPSLHGFLRWLDAESVAVAREHESGRDEVRVMTVHGAKGLEAPVVILPDTAPRRSPDRTPFVGIAGAAIWGGRKEDQPAPVRAARAAEALAETEERRRLLYVALTRAESLLVVCGAGTPKGMEESWYRHVEVAVGEAGAREEPAPAGLPGARLVIGAPWSPVPVAAPAAALTSTRAAPDWAGRPPPAPPAAPATLRPSDLGGAHALAGEEAEGARERGTRLHALLERLARVNPPGRGPAAAALAPDDPDLAQEALAVLADPDAAPFFGPGSLGEVDLVADLRELGGRRIAARLDRLLIRGGLVFAADLKSNRLVPAGPDSVPEGILRQMGAYQAALERIHPGREVRIALVWTGVPLVMPLARDQLFAALGRARPIS